MNENLTSHTSTSSSQGVSAEAISRRAYEIWEREGRPEGCDLRHWLQAEQELGVSTSTPPTQSQNGSAHTSEQPGTMRGNVDTRPLQQPTRVPASSSQKRPATPPTSGEKTGGTGGGQATAKRKPSNAPIL